MSRRARSPGRRRVNLDPRNGRIADRFRWLHHHRRFVMQKLLGTLFVALLFTSFQTSANGSGPMSGGSQAMSAPTPRSPAESARDEYNSGVRLIEKAAKLEAEAATAKTPEKGAKLLADARKKYTQSVEYFGRAIRYVPDMYQAWNYFGFAKRHLGSYDDALAAYGQALKLKPDYADAIEYQGEAYLGLNRLDDARANYMTLFRDQRPLADRLLAAMQAWLTERRKDPGTLDAGTLDAFASWIDERAHVGEQTSSFNRGLPPPTWSR
jgi:tetratricopeptide (TPR) repeat protein